MRYLTTVMNHWKQFLDPDLDEFRDVISCFLSTDASLSGEKFREDPISNFYVKLLTDKQREKERERDERTNTEWNNILFGGGCIMKYT